MNRFRAVDGRTNDFERYGKIATSRNCRKTNHRIGDANRAAFSAILETNGRR